MTYINKQLFLHLAKCCIIVFSCNVINEIIEVKNCQITYVYVASIASHRPGPWARLYPLPLTGVQCTAHYGQTRIQRMRLGTKGFLIDSFLCKRDKSYRTQKALQNHNLNFNSI